MDEEDKEEEDDEEEDEVHKHSSVSSLSGTGGSEVTVSEDTGVQLGGDATQRTQPFVTSLICDPESSAVT